MPAASSASSSRSSTSRSISSSISMSSSSSPNPNMGGGEEAGAVQFGQYLLRHDTQVVFYLRLDGGIAEDEGTSSSRVRLLPRLVVPWLWESIFSRRGVLDRCQSCQSLSNLEFLIDCTSFKPSGSVVQWWLKCNERVDMRAAPLRVQDALTIPNHSSPIGLAWPLLEKQLVRRIGNAYDFRHRNSFLN